MQRLLIGGLYQSEKRYKKDLIKDDIELKKSIQFSQGNLN